MVHDLVVGTGLLSVPARRTRTGLACHAAAVSRSLLVVDDHAGFRALARQVLDGDVFAVVGEAATCSEALQQAHDLAPDVVVLDVALPDGSGFDVARELIASSPAPAVVLVSSRSWSTLSRRLQQSGARGFLAKEQLSVAAVDGLVR